MGCTYTKKLFSLYFTWQSTEITQPMGSCPVPSPVHWEAYLGRERWAKRDAPLCLPGQYEPLSPPSVQIAAPEGWPRTVAGSPATALTSSPRQAAFWRVTSCPRLFSGEATGVWKQETWVLFPALLDVLGQIIPPGLSLPICKKRKELTKARVPLGQSPGKLVEGTVT